MSETPRGIDAGPVSAWLATNIDGAVGPFRFEFITGGHSNLTFKVTGADQRAFVLRRPPLGAVLATAHDMSREHRIITGVGQTGVPVPQALGLCTDDSVNGAPFYVMNYVDGVVLHDGETAASETAPPQRATLSQQVADVLGTLHLADPAAVGLGDLGRTEAYLDRQLKRWRTQWEKSKTRELTVMEEAYAALVEAKPAQRYTGIVHGDYRLGNMLIDGAEGRITAVLDWELCTLGDVLADVGYLLNAWRLPGEPTVRAAVSYPTEVPGFFDRQQLVERYQQRTGFDLDGIGYYQAFQHWRLAAIVEGVLARYEQGVMGDSEVDQDAYRTQVETMATEAVALMS